MQTLPTPDPTPAKQLLTTTSDPARATSYTPTSSPLQRRVPLVGARATFQYDQDATGDKVEPLTLGQHVIASAGVVVHPPIWAKDAVVVPIAALWQVADRMHDQPRKDHAAEVGEVVPGRRSLLFAAALC